MFKLKNGFYFERLEDGTVKIGHEARGRDGHVTEVAEAAIPPEQWGNLVAGLSARGKTVGNRIAARKLHGQ